MLSYCTRCIMPSTKPDLTFDHEGVCAACRSYENRQVVNWDERRAELVAILESNRGRGGSNYDCIVPVSGGKDSTYQVLKLLELGANPLCVTATTDDLSEIGRRNIENIKKLGVDYIEVSVNPLVRRKLNRIGLREVGDISWPEHVTIFTIPVRMAVALKIPLIVWGENPQNEYGGPATAAEDKVLTRRWLEEFGGLLGLRVADLVGLDGLTERDLIQYAYPRDEELASVGVSGLFLGYFMPWDGYTNALVAQARGFETYPTNVEGSLVNYENLDNHQTGIHDYFKYLKYGYARATDQACLHIRRGRLSRSDAVALVQEIDGRFPSSYLGKTLERILAEIGVTLGEFQRICDQFTNKKIFRTDSRGELLRQPDGTLIKLNYDNP